MLSNKKFDPKRVIDDLISQGWSVGPHFLPLPQLSDLAEEARKLWRDDKFRKAGIGGGDQRHLRPEIRSDFVLWLDPDNLTPTQRSYWNAIEQLRVMLNEEIHLGLNDFEAHLVVYPPRAFYRKHLDQFKQVKERLISCILYLNPFWNPADGGQLRIYTNEENDPDSFIQILPEAGTFVCFRSELIYHEVLPASRERYSVTGWLKKRSLFS